MSENGLKLVENGLANIIFELTLSKNEVRTNDRYLELILLNIKISHLVQ